MQQHLLLLAVGVCVLIVTQVFAVRFGFYRSSRQTDETPVRFFKAMIWAFVLFFVIELFLLPGIALLWLYVSGKQMLAIEAQGWLNFSAIVTLAVALSLYVARCDSNVKKALFGSAGVSGMQQAVKDALFGAFSLLVSYPVVLVVGQVMALVVLTLFQAPRLDQVAVQHLKLIGDFPALYWATVLCFVSVVPWVEELLFRGFLQTSLKEFFGIKGALFTTSLIFTVFHFSVAQGLENIELLTSLFVLSCYLGWVYERQRSLFAPLGLHIVFNIFGVILVNFGEHI